MKPRPEQTPEQKPRNGRPYAGLLKIMPMDFILANDMGMCEGAAISYLTGWHNTGNVHDLREAQSYITHLCRVAVKIEKMRRGRAILNPEITATEYIKSHDFQGQAAACIKWIYFWSHNGQEEALEMARRACVSLIQDARAGGGCDG